MQSSASPDQANQPRLAALLTLSIALISISFAPIFIRFSETELGANATVFNRFAIFVLCFGSLHWGKQRFSPDAEVETSEPLTLRRGLLLTGVGISSMISLVLWAMSLQYTTIAKCMLLNNLTPLFTSLGSWLLWKKRFDRRFLIGMAIALVGAIALGLEDIHGADGFLLGDLYALLSAAFLGIYFLLVEQLRNWFSATTILLWRCVIGSAMLLPVVLFTERQLFPQTTVAILAVLGLGLISEGFGQRLLADCLDTLSSSFVALFLLLEPIVSAVLAWFIFMEKLSPATWIGFTIILMGIYLAQSSQNCNQTLNSVQTPTA